MGVNHSFITEWDNAPKTIMEFDKSNISPASAVVTFDKMIQHQIPSIDDFVVICKQAAQLFKQQPNCVEVEVQTRDRIIIVGDMHGCFETLIRLFRGDEETGVQPLGFPGPQADGRRNVYLFNGDLIDRGGSGYQIVFALAIFAMLFPQCVYINRGNHESEMFGLSTQTGMGHKFMFEVQQKFPTIDFSRYKPAVSELFYSFPICHIIDKNIFVVHGGVPMANDMTGVPLPSSPFPTTMEPRNTARVQLPKGATPFPVSELAVLNPPRTQTANLEDSPRKRNELWHSFLWSYDRLPYSADFMEFNGYKTMVNSHTATPYHFITTFLPIDQKQQDKYGIQSVTRGQDTFVKVKDFFDEHPNLAKIKLSVVEIFSSPTNQGQLYSCVLDAQDKPVGQKLDFDPLNWNYKYLGTHTDFKFIQQQPQ